MVEAPRLRIDARSRIEFEGIMKKFGVAEDMRRVLSEYPCLLQGTGRRRLLHVFHPAVYMRVAFSEKKPGELEVQKMLGVLSAKGMDALLRSGGGVEKNFPEEFKLMSRRADKALDKLLTETWRKGREQLSSVRRYAKNLKNLRAVSERIDWWGAVRTYVDKARDKGRALELVNERHFHIE